MLPSYCNVVQARTNQHWKARQERGGLLCHKQCVFDSSIPQGQRYSERKYYCKDEYLRKKLQPVVD